MQPFQPRAVLVTAAVAALVACAGDPTPREEADMKRSAARAELGREADEARRDATSTPAEQIAGEASTAAAINGSRAEQPATTAPATQLLSRGIAGNAMHAGPGRHADALAGLRAPSEPIDRERYAPFDDNPVKLTAEHPLSTFSIDVDTGAYSNVRRFLTSGGLPPQDAVRVEELINYFSYGYPVADDPHTPFSVSTEIAPAPWNAEALLLQIGIKGFEVPVEERPPANLVFLIDVSGSMASEDKLPLLKNAFRLLARELDARDRVSMVVYAGATGIVLEPTPGDALGEILGALGQLSAGGRTNGAAGIRLAYDMAEQAFVDGGINRVVLATDGDFNVGTVTFNALVDLVERERERGVSLTTLGFGTGNYNDHLMEQLADAGNGNYAYIDNLNEARKVLVEELSATLQTIAKDVKIQIEFNPAVVAEYRLVGYENRVLRREDFNNDRIDAGEIGAGHTVTALYELVLVDSAARRVDPLRYAERGDSKRAGARELAWLRLRYKAPDGDSSRLIERPIERREIRQADATSDDFRFAAAVAAFGQQLRGGDYLENYDYASIAILAAESRGADHFGYRTEFLSLVRLAESLDAGDSSNRQAMR